MVTIVERGIPAGIGVDTLKPGQLAKVVANGGVNHNDCFIVGVGWLTTKAATLSPYCTIYAINLSTGIPVTNPNTIVMTYPENIVLKLDTA